MQTRLRFSPGTSEKAIKFLTRELNRIQKKIPSKIKVVGGIDSKWGPPYYTWINLKVEKSNLRAFRHSSDEHHSIVGVIADLEKKLEKWLGTPKSDRSLS